MDSASIKQRISERKRKPIQQQQDQQQQQYFEEQQQQLQFVGNQHQQQLQQLPLQPPYNHHPDFPGQDSSYYLPSPHMDFNALPDAVLHKMKSKYRIKFKSSVTGEDLDASKIPREQLIDAVSQHFYAQEISEKDTTAFFIYTVRNIGKSLTGGEGTRGRGRHFGRYCS